MLNRLFIRDNQLLRVLKERDNDVLVIDCIKKNMPYWIDKKSLNSFVECSEKELVEKSNIEFPSLNSLSQKELNTMYFRFGSISYLLLKYDDEIEKRLAIHQASIDYNISEQTIRHRLCDYLTFQNILILAPSVKFKKEMTSDEKNYRWALNKYFYNSKKLSLRQAYKYMIREKYTDFNGKILQNQPKFHQFKYFYYKNRSESNFVISRWGRGEYNKNYRPLLGNGVRDCFPSIGYGMLDSTTCDIYLVNNAGELIGRPILSACIDAYSGMCLGYSLGWEGGINSLRKLMNNVIANKVEHCKKFGIDIKEEDWNCHWVPHKLITDKGNEYVGETFSQLVDLGIEFINLEPYRPELKSTVERFFGLIQESFKKELLNKGVVLKDFGDRGSIDYRKLACLTLEQFEKIILLCIIHYNCGRAIEIPLGIENVKNHSKDLWNYCLDSCKDRLIDVNQDTLNLALLPRTVGKFRRDGLHLNKLRYKAFGFTDDYLAGNEALVAYDPKNVSHIWLIKNNKYYQFDLIEPFFEKMSLSQANNYLNKRVDNQVSNEELQSEIELVSGIELVAQDSFQGRVRIKGIRKNKKKEVLK